MAVTSQQSGDQTSALATSVEDWYRYTDGRPVPHMWPEDPGRLKECSDAIRTHLHKLLSYPPPEAWFSDGQFRLLFEELKHMVGAKAIVQPQRKKEMVLDVGKGYSITLQNVVLLLAAGTRDYSDQWIDDVRWDGRIAESEVLSRFQTHEQAQEATRALIDFFRHIGRDEVTGESCIKKKGVSLTNILTVRLSVNFLEQKKVGKKPGVPMLEKLKAFPSPSTGTAYNAFVRVLMAACKASHGLESRCAINWYASPDNPAQSTVEFRPCHL